MLAWMQTRMMIRYFKEIRSHTNFHLGLGIDGRGFEMVAVVFEVGTTSFSSSSVASCLPDQLGAGVFGNSIGTTSIPSSISLAFSKGLVEFLRSS